MAYIRKSISELEISPEKLASTRSSEWQAAIPLLEFMRNQLLLDWVINPEEPKTPQELDALCQEIGLKLSNVYHKGKETLR